MAPAHACSVGTVNLGLPNRGGNIVQMLAYCRRLTNINISLFEPLLCSVLEMACSGIHPGKWNESGFRPPLCTYRLNWARRTSWGWWDDWDDTVLQTQDSKFEPWRSEAEHATSRSRRLPTILTFTRGWGRNNFVSFKPPRPGTEPRTLAWKAAVLTTTLGPPPYTRVKAFELSDKYLLTRKSWIWLALGAIHVIIKFPSAHLIKKASEDEIILWTSCAKIGW